jgi:hypothetical protein
MRSRGTSTVGGAPHAVFWCCIARMQRCGEGDFVLITAIASVGEVASWPLSVFVVGEIDATVVPRISISIQAPVEASS